MRQVVYLYAVQKTTAQWVENTSAWKTVKLTFVIFQALGFLT